ncbi:MAG: YihY/virulence factor BrkB family protein [Nitrospirota bacterium]
MISRIINFLKNDLWIIPLDDLSFLKSLLIKQLRIIMIAVRGFAEDRCQLRASALTFYSLLSIVPVLAMAFGIAKGFGMDKLLEEQLMEKMQGQEEVIINVIAFARSMLDNTKGGLIAGIGVALIFWTVIKMLGNIEKSFNDIWGVKKERNIGRKFSDYISMVLISPVLLIMSSSITVFISSQVMLITQKIALLGAVSSIVFAGLKLLPYCVIWILFTFIYIFMPNTKVNFRAGLLAGIVAGTTYQLGQWGYINFQIGVAKYNAIYGSFAALPLFLIWLQLSWLIVLFGAEISFAHQNVETYEYEADSLNVSYSFKKLLSLRITHLLIINFCKGEHPLTITQISQSLNIPIRLARQILYELSESEIVSEIREGEDDEAAYQPAQCVDNLTAQYVIEALEKNGNDKIPVAESKELESLSACLKEFHSIIEKSPANVPLKNI